MQNLRIEKLKNLSLVALLMAGAAFAACSSSSDEIIEPVTPESPTTAKTYTLTIKASKGSDAATRALTPGTDSETGKNTVEAYWSGEEQIVVVKPTSDPTEFEKIGEASATASDDGSTTITATLTGEPSGNLYFLLNGSTFDYTGQVGLLTGNGGNSISEKYDYAVATLSSDKYTVDGLNITPKSGVTLDFSAQQAIVKFTLKDKSNNAINATKLNIHEEFGVLMQSFDYLTSDGSNGDITISPSSGTDVIYAALRGVWGDLTLTAIYGNYIYSYSKSSVGFSDGQYYEITVKMNKILTRVTDYGAISNGTYKAISEDEAKELAKRCWKVAGDEINVIYSRESDYYFNCACTNDGENAGTSIKSIFTLASEGTGWFVEPVVTYTAPTLVSGTLTYNGSAQALVTGGSATDGTMYYSTDGSTWSRYMPTGTNAGTYTVYYKVEPYYPGYTGVERTLLGSKTINKADWTGGSVTVINDGFTRYHASYSGPGDITKWEYSTNGGQYYIEDSSTSNTSNQKFDATHWKVTIGADDNHNQTTFIGSYSY